MMTRGSPLAKLASLSLGLICALVIAELALRLLGLGFLREQAGGNAGMDEGEVRTILCLGESSTALGGAQAYPRQLERLLNANGGGQRFRVISGARPGINSDYLLSHLEESLAETRFDVVTVMMGINDELSLFQELDDASEGSAPWTKLKLYRLARFLGAHWQQRREEKLLRSTIEQLKQACGDSGSDAAARFAPCKELTLLYWKNGMLEEEEAQLRWLVQHYDRPQLAIDLARITDDPQEKERLLLGVIDRFPAKEHAFRWLVALYAEQGRSEESAALLSRLIEADPVAKYYVELAKHYRGEGELEEAEHAYLDSLDASYNFYALRELGTLYGEQGRHSEAIWLLKRSLELQPCAESFAVMGKILLAAGQLEQAELAFEQAITAREERCPYSTYSWNTNSLDINEARLSLAGILHARGEEEHAKSHLDQIGSGQRMARNYRQLVEVVMARVERLVVVQYPNRRIEPLRALVPQQEGIVFVENLDNFRTAVAAEGYNAYFIDHYGGDFGHTTGKGHALIAQAIAEVILGEFYPTQDLEQSASSSDNPR